MPTFVYYRTPTRCPRSSSCAAPSASSPSSGSSQKFRRLRQLAGARDAATCARYQSLCERKRKNFVPWPVAGYCYIRERWSSSYLIGIASDEPIGKRPQYENIFFSHAVDLKIIKSSSLLPAAKPTGHRTVKVVVVVGGLLWGHELEGRPKVKVKVDWTLPLTSRP